MVNAVESWLLVRTADRVTMVASEQQKLTLFNQYDFSCKRLQQAVSLSHGKETQDIWRTKDAT
jgi:hypothetical protein